MLTNWKDTFRPGETEEPAPKKAAAKKPAAKKPAAKAAAKKDEQADESDEG